MQTTIRQLPVLTSMLSIIPACEATEGEVMPDVAEELPSRTSRVLIAEDDVELRHMLSYAIQMYKWNWDLSKSGEEAQEKYREAQIQRNPYAMVVLDIAMPDRCGFEVARWIRAQGGKDVKIAFLTGFDGTINRQEAEQMGACGYWVKPMLPVDINDEIEAILSQEKK